MRFSKAKEGKERYSGAGTCKCLNTDELQFPASLTVDHVYSDKTNSAVSGKWHVLTFGELI